MRFRMKTGLRAAKWTLALVSFGVFSESMTSVAQAHHPHFRHCGHFGFRHTGFGLGYSSFGFSPYWNSGFSTGFYGFGSPFFCAPRFHCAPRFYSYSYAVPYISVPINTYYYEPSIGSESSGTGCTRLGHRILAEDGTRECQTCLERSDDARESCITCFANTATVRF